MGSMSSRARAVAKPGDVIANSAECPLWREWRRGSIALVVDSEVSCGAWNLTLLTAGTARLAWFQVDAFDVAAEVVDSCAVIA